MSYANNNDKMDIPYGAKCTRCNGTGTEGEEQREDEDFEEYEQRIIETLGEDEAIMCLVCSRCGGTGIEPLDE